MELCLDLACFTMLGLKTLYKNYQNCHLSWSLSGPRKNWVRRGHDLANSAFPSFGVSMKSSMSMALTTISASCACRDSPAPCVFKPWFSWSSPENRSGVALRISSSSSSAWNNRWRSKTQQGAEIPWAMWLLSTPVKNQANRIQLKLLSELFYLYAL